MASFTSLGNHPPKNFFNFFCLPPPPCSSPQAPPHIPTRLYRHSFSCPQDPGHCPSPASSGPTAKGKNRVYPCAIFDRLRWGYDYRLHQRASPSSRPTSSPPIAPRLRENTPYITSVSTRAGQHVCPTKR